eukprot:g8844.t1
MLFIVASLQIVVAKTHMKEVLKNKKKVDELQTEVMRLKTNDTKLENRLLRIERAYEDTSLTSKSANRQKQHKQIQEFFDDYISTIKQNETKEIDACRKERSDGNAIFPVLVIDDHEIETIEDTYCIDTNRDELLKSFCSFTSDLDNLFQILKVDATAKTFWPNICCKERKHETLEVCEDPHGRIKREDIIPFALSQGGDYSRHNLYVEVTSALESGGYLHKGLLNAVDFLYTRNQVPNEATLKKTLKKNTKERINDLFDDISMCGPRLLRIGEKRGCQQFLAYQRTFRVIYNLFESVMTPPMKIKHTIFLESMENSFRKRQLSLTRQSKVNEVGGTMDTKAKPKDDNDTAIKKKCDADTGKHIKPDKEKLPRLKDIFCRDTFHIELYDQNYVNVLYMYADDIQPTYTQYAVELQKGAIFQSTSTQCEYAPLIQSLSLQHTKTHIFDNDQKTFAIMAILNTRDKRSYFSSELPFCKQKDYLIGSGVNIKIHLDVTGCCGGDHNYNHCDELCRKTLRPLKMYTGEIMTREIEITGTTYKLVKSKGNPTRRRRRLFQGNANHNS